MLYAFSQCSRAVCIQSVQSYCIHTYGWVVLYIQYSVSSVMLYIFSRFGHAVCIHSVQSCCIYSVSSVLLYAFSQLSCCVHWVIWVVVYIHSRFSRAVCIQWVQSWSFYLEVSWAGVPDRVAPEYTFTRLLDILYKWDWYFLTVSFPSTEHWKGSLTVCCTSSSRRQRMSWLCYQATLYLCSRKMLIIGHQSSSMERRAAYIPSISFSHSVSSSVFYCNHTCFFLACVSHCPCCRAFIQS